MPDDLILLTKAGELSDRDVFILESLEEAPAVHSPRLPPNLACQRLAAEGLIETTRAPDGTTTLWITVAGLNELREHRNKGT